MSFFSELRRRNVYRVAAVYVIVGWLVLQVADVFMSFLPLPAWTPTLIFVLLVLGFPVALVLAWSLEITPKGVRLETGPESAGRSQSKHFRPLDLILVAGLLAVGAYALYSRPSAAPTPVAAENSQIDSVVVLPLDDLTNDPDQAYFVAGMHEALITELSKVKALRVISKTSAATFKGSATPIAEIARTLKVDAVVEGSVLRVGDTVRVSAQLIDAASDSHLWAENYDRPMTDILSLYGEVAREIVAQIQVNITANEVSRLTTSQSVQPKVYERYLEAHYLCENWSPHEMSRGIELLREAVEWDPDFAPAQAELAMCLQYSAFFNYQNAEEITDESEAAANRAVALDPELAEAYVALAGIRYYLQYKRDAAELFLRQALELNPGSVKALYHLSWLLGESGRFDEALVPTRKAIANDPFNTVSLNALGQIQYLARNFEASIKANERALALDPADPWLHFSLALAHLHNGDSDRASEFISNAVQRSGRSPLYVAGQAYVFAVTERKDKAMELLRELERSDKNPFSLGFAYVGLGDHEKAIDQLELAYQQHNSQLVYLPHSATFDPLRNNPRFQALLRKLGW